MDNNIADSEKRFHLFHGNVSEKYKDWPSPDVIISMELMVLEDSGAIRRRI